MEHGDKRTTGSMDPTISTRAKGPMQAPAEHLGNSNRLGHSNHGVKVVVSSGGRRSQHIQEEDVDVTQDKEEKATKEKMRNHHVPTAVGGTTILRIASTRGMAESKRRRCRDKEPQSKGRH